MVNFLDAMMTAISSGRLPLGQELDIEKSGQWALLSPSAKQTIIAQVMGLFEHYHGAVVRYAPMLASNSDYFRPLQCMPTSVLETLLSGDQELHSLDEEGSSCQWAHIFTENAGISDVTIIGIGELRLARAARSRSRSESAERPRQQQKQQKQQKQRKRHQARETASAVYRPRGARQSVVGYFPFLLSDLASQFLDLEFAQIYSAAKPLPSQYQAQQCLISSLEYYGVATANLSDIGQYFKNFAIHVPLKCLQYVAEKCGVSLRITYYRNNYSGTKVHKVDVEGKEPIRLAAYCNHIFPDVDIPCSMYFIRNMEELAKAVKAGHIDRKDVFRARSKICQKDRYELASKEVTMSSAKVVHTLFACGHFEKLIRSTKLIQLEPEQDVKLEEAFADTCQRMWEYRPVDSREPRQDVEDDDDIGDCDYRNNHMSATADVSYIFFAADFEAFTREDGHEACLGGLMQLDVDAKTVSEDCTRVQIFEGPTLITSLFNALVAMIRAGEKKAKRKYTHKVVYFHNLRYDRTLFEKNPDILITNVCDKDTTVYSLKARFMGCAFQIRDSYKLIPLPLRQFASHFNLPPSLQKKDFSVYNYFTPENAHDAHTCTPLTYVSAMTFDGDKTLDAAERKEYVAKLCGYLDEQPRQGTARAGHFHPWLLYKDYLRYDVLILAAGLETFRREMLHITQGELDPLHSLTLPSFANRYMGHNGAFDGMYELSGSLRAYQGQAVAGGRVFVSPSAEGRYLQGKFAYLDAVGLYPSAIAFVCEEMGGFPTGPCSVLRSDQLSYDFLRANATEFTVTICISKIGKRQRDIPFIKLNTKAGMDYVNELPEGKPFRTTVDRVTLEDYIEFHRIEFTVEQGIYWQGPRNTAFGAIQRQIHAERTVAKKAGEVARGNLYKLIGNSAYGKLLQKTSPTDKLMIKCFRQEGAGSTRVESNWRLALYNYLHLMKSFRFVGEHQIEVTRFKQDDSYTLCHIGSQVLAASKRLMNRVFNLASDMKLNLYYTDTDSFVCDHGAVPALAGAFAARYGFPLLGTEMMRFHSDFTFKLPNGKALDPERVYSTDFWPMGKKLYCHALEGETEEGEVVNSIQFKCKGCTHEGLIYKAREYGKGDEGVMGLYMALSMAEEIEVPLNPPGVARFVYDKDNRVSTHGKVFMRTLRSKAAQRIREREAKSAPQAFFGCPECEYELTTGHIQSPHKHTCHQTPQLEEVVGIVATRGSLPPPLRSLKRGDRGSEGSAATRGALQHGDRGSEGTAPKRVKTEEDAAA